MSKQDAGQIVKYGFFTLLLLTVVISFWIYMVKYRGGTEQVSPSVSEIILALEEAGFFPADPDKKPGMPGGSKSVAGITPVVEGSGSVYVDPGQQWPDTLPVQVSVFEGPGGVPWIGTWVAGKPVQWEEKPSIQWPLRPRGDSHWRAVSQIAYFSEESGVDIGLGAAWTPVEIIGTRLGFSATFDASVFTDLDPKWAAVSLHGDRELFGPVVTGVGAGVRYMDNTLQFHPSFNLGLRLDF